MAKAADEKGGTKAKSANGQLLAAADAGDHEGMKTALKEGADANSKGRVREDNDLAGRSALMRCAARGDVEGVKMLLGGGADPKTLVEMSLGWFSYALHQAAEHGHANLVPVLVR